MCTRISIRSTVPLSRPGSPAARVVDRGSLKCKTRRVRDGGGFAGCVALWWVVRGVKFWCHDRAGSGSVRPATAGLLPVGESFDIESPRR